MRAVLIATRSNLILLLRTIQRPLRFATIMVATNFIERGFILEVTAPVARKLVATSFIAALVSAAIRRTGIRAAIVLTFGCREFADGKHVVLRIGGSDRARFDPWAAEIRQNFLGLNLTLAQGGEIISYGFFLVEADLAGVGTDETFIENSAGKLVKVFVFKST